MTLKIYKVCDQCGMEALDTSVSGRSFVKVEKSGGTMHFCSPWCASVLLSQFEKPERIKND